jgi:hypothetical protein
VLAVVSAHRLSLGTVRNLTRFICSGEVYLDDTEVEVLDEDEDEDEDDQSFHSSDLDVPPFVGFRNGLDPDPYDLWETEEDDDSFVVSDDHSESVSQGSISASLSPQHLTSASPSSPSSRGSTPASDAVQREDDPLGLFSVFDTMDRMGDPGERRRGWAAWFNRARANQRDETTTSEGARRNTSAGGRARLRSPSLTVLPSSQTRRRDANRVVVVSSSDPNDLMSAEMPRSNPSLASETTPSPRNGGSATAFRPSAEAPSSSPLGSTGDPTVVESVSQDTSGASGTRSSGSRVTRLRRNINSGRVSSDDPVIVSEPAHAPGRRRRQRPRRVIPESDSE